MAVINTIINRYKEIPGGIIEAYHGIQEEFSFIPEGAILAAAKAFGIPVAEAYGVATFYSYFKIGERGNCVIRLCESSPCHIAGAAEVVAALEKELGIEMGQTTPDGKFTLEFTQCVGQCQATPVITINSQPFADVTAEKIPGILSQYK
ncbi:MAG: NAD(P)H-dependent oxidoreductase subunit E [Syntrophomonadaceae bacterium]|nr:NAD(P)H-dependent oxidoreductase subunit E [Syntrophomonadaceae bacterium]